MQLIRVLERYSNKSRRDAVTPDQFNEVPILICDPALVEIDLKSNLGQNWWGLILGNEAGGS